MSRTPLDASAPASSPEGAVGARAAGADVDRVDGADGADGADGSVASADDRADADGAAVDIDGAVDDAAAADDVERRFGEQPATRFAADVEYRGRAGEHDYVVRVRHRLLDTTFTVEIDGIEHDPKAEEKARKAREKAGEVDDAGAGDEREAAALQDVEEPASDADDAEQAEGFEQADQAHYPEDAEQTDGSEDTESALQFGLEDGFSTLRCTVRRPREGGEIKDCEVITIRTAGLGGAGEVEIRHGFRTTVLIPAEGSPSALRDEKRTVHPTRYALVAALTKGAKFLIPLLGLGALFSGLLDPVKEWVEDRIRPAVEAIVRVTQPIRDWIGEVTRPVREFLDMLLSPVWEFLAWLLDLLFGWLPNFSFGLDLDIPEWVVDVAVPLLVVVVVFVATYSGLKNRREKLAETTAQSEGAAATSARKDGAATPPNSDKAAGVDEEDPAGREEVPPAS